MTQTYGVDERVPIICAGVVPATVPGVAPFLIPGLRITGGTMINPSDGIYQLTMDSGIADADLIFDCNIHSMPGTGAFIRQSVGGANDRIKTFLTGLADGTAANLNWSFTVRRFLGN